MLLDIVSIAFVCVGLLIFLGAAAGLVRFPDFYSRMHAAGKGDSLGSLLIVLGFAIHEFGDFSGMDFVLVLKLLGVCAFIMFTSPTATHALIDAGYEDGIEPVIDPGAEDALARRLGGGSNQHSIEP
jgi:multicomponent Na+:H+ antiporter subunit G